MNFEEYLAHFAAIVEGRITAAPYNEPEMLHYTKMNHTRMQRWLKKGVVTAEIEAVLKKINRPQQWILITEPWCGDAAHSVPFVYLLSQVNPLIDLQIQLRDSHSEIDQYLTNGGKAIPILILRNESGQDRLVWGPRPATAQQVFLEEKEMGTSYEDLKLRLQAWYNEDKGQTLQQELLAQEDALLAV